MTKKIKHIGRGKYEEELTDGSIKQPSTRIRQMIIFTYLEGFSTPPVGWSVSREKLYNDYNKKALESVLTGGTTPNTSFL